MQIPERKQIFQLKSTYKGRAFGFPLNYLFDIL